MHTTSNFEKKANAGSYSEELGKFYRNTKQK